MNGHYRKDISEYTSKRPSLKQWSQINKVLSLKEKILFYFLVVILAGSLIGWLFLYYVSRTNSIPAFGGEYIEGIVGQPEHINAVIASSNNVDDDLSQIVYSSLLKYDGRGNLIPDLAENYEISDDKMLYTFHLKQNIAWHDGRPLNASDVLFTINLITDPAYKSPLRTNWLGIESNYIDDYTLSFSVKSPYVGLLNNLTFGIMPKHIWESVGSDKFSLTDLNLQPIGSGAYKFNSIQKDSNGNIITYKLNANPNYYGDKPYISKITFNFYPDDESVIEAYNKKEVMGISSISALNISDIKLAQSTALHKFSRPRYFSVFINQTKSLPLAEDEAREALSYATNRQEIVDKVLNGVGHPIYFPVLHGMIGYTDDVEKREFDLEKANKLLDDNQWNHGDDGIRSKKGTRLEINLYTTDWKELEETASLLKEEWGRIGAQVNLNVLSISDIQQNYIRPREYDALLIGQDLGAEPDPYSFWHSDQKKDPGLNLSLFGDAKTDKLIADGRIEFDNEKRAEIYKEFQQLLAKEIPAIFLYSPDYIYPVNKKVRGIEISNLISPAERFSGINHWYISTKRIWK